MKNIKNKLKKFCVIINDTSARFSSMVGWLLYSGYFNLEKRMLVLTAILRKHPLPSPWIGLENGQNKKSSGAGRAAPMRVENIVKNIPADANTLVDIGANNCYFSIKISEMLGIHAICYEPDLEFLRVAFSSFGNRKSKVAICAMSIRSENVHLVPCADVFLILSVAQRWLHYGGRDEAEKILSILFNKTNKVLFFEIPNPFDSSKERKHLAYLGENQAEFDKSIENLFMGFGASSVIKLEQLYTDHNDDYRRDLYIISK